MIRFFLLIFIFIRSVAFSCELLSGHSYIVLSGAVAQELKALGLLRDKKLKAITTYSGLDKKEFTGEWVGGGLQFSPKQITKFGKTVTFFDESREIKQGLGKIATKAIEIKTRNMTPVVAIEKIHEVLRPFLKGCEKKSQQEIKTLKSKRQLAMSKFSGNGPVPALFFLGEIVSGERMPSLLMLNDGPVLDLLNEKIIKSYPSELAYVPWSQKTMKQFEKTNSPWKVGIETSAKSNGLKRVEKNKKILLLKYPNGLVPGRLQYQMQLYFLNAFYDLVRRPDAP